MMIGEVLISIIVIVLACTWTVLDRGSYWTVDWIVRSYWIVLCRGALLA